MTYKGELSPEQRLSMLEARVASLERITHGELSGGDGAKRERLIMSWPCGDIARRQLAPWFDATGYGTLYQNGTQYHTGHDLNKA